MDNGGNFGYAKLIEMLEKRGVPPRTSVLNARVEICPKDGGMFRGYGEIYKFEKEKFQMAYCRCSYTLCRKIS